MDLFSSARLPQHMSMKRLALELNMDRSACRRWVLKQGVKPVRRRTGDSGFQVALTVTMDQAAQLKKIRQEEGYLSAPAPVPRQIDLSEVSDDDLLAELKKRLDLHDSEDE